MHTTLKPITNVAMIILWGVLAGLFTYLSAPFSYVVVVIALFLGLDCGIIQNLALKEAQAKLVGTTTMLDVRKRLKETKWGKRYIIILWLSYLLIMVIVFLNNRGQFAFEIFAGFFSLMFIREITTFKSTVEIMKIS